MKKAAIVALLLGFLMQSCLPVLIGSVAYSASKSKKAQQEWSQTFQSTNLERERAGLKPLDYCVEAARFDRTWALRDPACRNQLGVPARLAPKKHR